MEIIKTLSIVAAVLSLSACMTTVKDPDCHPQLCGTRLELTSLSSFDESDMKSGSTTIMTLSKDDTNGTKIFRENLVSGLNVAGIRSKDDEISSKVKNEIIEHIFLEGGSYGGSSPANYVLTLKLDSLSGYGSYSPSETKKDKDGNSYRTSSSCTYKYTYSANVKVNRMPDLAMIRTIDFSDSDTDYESNPSSSSCRVSDSMLAAKLSEMVKKNIKRGEAAKNLLEILSPKYYVYDSYDVKGKIYFLTNIKKENGAAEGRKVKLYSVSDNDSLLYLGDGQLVGMDYSNREGTYLKAKPEVAQYVKKGTIIKLSADEACGFICLTDIVNGL